MDCRRLAPAPRLVRVRYTYIYIAEFLLYVYIKDLSNCGMHNAVFTKPPLPEGYSP